MSSKALAKGEEKEKRPEQILYRITDFENHETIGTGAFSRVRLVRNILEDQMRCVKVIKKLDIISRDLLKYVRGEAYLLRTCDHPFLLRSLGKYQDASSIYIVFELLRGGDLHHRLKALGTLPEADCRFYASQVVLGLEHLHKMGVVYRGVKPENLVVDDQGYCKVVDFGLSKLIRTAKTLTLCGDPEYVAPEVLLRAGYGREADLWALGVLVFELLCGFPPFYDANPLGIYQKVLKGKFVEPKLLHKHDCRSARSFVEHLLRRDVRKRLGGQSSGAAACRHHAWLSRTEWARVLAKDLDPPFVPKMARANVRDHFNEYLEEEENTRRLAPLAAEDVKAIDDIVNNKDDDPTDLRPQTPDKRPKTPGKGGDDHPNDRGAGAPPALADAAAAQSSSSRFNFFRRTSSKKGASSSTIAKENAETPAKAPDAKADGDAKADDDAERAAAKDDGDDDANAADPKSDDAAAAEDDDDAKRAKEPHDAAPLKHRKAAIVARPAPAEAKADDAAERDDPPPKDDAPADAAE